MKKRGRKVRICPKCGHADCRFLKSGLMRCEECRFTGHRPVFSGGGPQSKHQIKGAGAPVVHIGNGALWKLPIRGDDYD